MCAAMLTHTVLLAHARYAPKPVAKKTEETGTEDDLSEWLPEDTIGATKKSD
jgi:hypothetical protein